MTNLKNLICGIVWAIACFCGSSATAQQQDAERPKPAAHEYAPLVEANTDLIEQSTGAVQPDSLPVTGIQNLTLGRPPVRHSYVVPGIQYGNTYSSGSSGSASTGPKPGWNSMSFVSGNVSLLQEWSHSALSTNYSGGGYFS